MNIFEKIIDDVITEAQNNSTEVLKKIVKELQGPDFNMGKAPNDGNGFAFAKGNNLIIRDPYFYSFNVNPKVKEKDWLPGGFEYKYFVEKYPGLMIRSRGWKQVDEADKRKKTFGGLNGYYEFTYEVSI